MAENDIYNNEHNYKKFLNNIDKLVQVPKDDDRRKKYYVKNSDNLKYYRQLCKHFNVVDISYIRRIRLLKTLNIITFATEKNLSECEREDINDIVSYFNSTDRSPRTKRDFIIDMKFIWKILFPELDEKGRTDETLIPYAVRHLSSKVDKSRQKMRDDKLTLEEIDKLIIGFRQEPRIQAFVSLMIDTLVRPQELLYVKLKNVEIFDNFAKIWISEHGKEGIKMLQVIDSYPYLTNWLNQHPKRNDPESYLFINLGVVNRFQQMKMRNINKLLKNKCEELGIKKPITPYSLKRNGVTIARLRGDSDVSIQHKAGWTSTNQLKTYDMSNAEESFKVELIKRGIMKPEEKYKHIEPLSKKCVFCETINPKTNEVCSNCHRPLDRKKILAQQEAFEIINSIDKDLIDNLKQAIAVKRSQYYAESKK